VSSRLEQCRGDFGRQRLPAEVVVPVNVFICSSRNEPRGEDLAKRGIITAPLKTNKIDHRLIKACSFRIVPPKRTAGVATVEQQFRNALWMFRGVCSTDRGSLRNAEEGERLSQISRLHDVFHIRNPTFEGEVADIPVSHSAAALVVTNVAVVVSEEPDPVTPDRTLPLILEMRQPVCRFNHAGPRACFRPGELDSVCRPHVSDSLSRLLH
jgi:hypothetical protein